MQILNNDTKLVEAYDFSIRTLNCLMVLEIETVGQLIYAYRTFSAVWFYKHPHLGRKTYSEITDAVECLEKKLNIQEGNNINLSMFSTEELLEEIKSRCIH